MNKLKENFELYRNRIVILFSFILVTYIIYTHAYFPPSPFTNRGIILGLSYIIYFFLYYSPEESLLNKIISFISTILCVSVSIYMIVSEPRIIQSFYRANYTDYIMIIIYIIGGAVLMRRNQGGKVIGLLAIIGFLYLKFGYLMPGIFTHKGFTVGQIGTMLLTDPDKGAFGDLMGVVARILSIFFLFASLLIISGLGDLINSLAIYFLGEKKGGPAKIAVVTSGLFGMVSGSPVANVAATGSFTIPLMKRLGYDAKTAASVEAIASSGGGLVPPIMGLGAFVMAEIVGVSYTVVCAWGIVPAVLWYWISYWIVDNNAYKYDVKLWKPNKEETIKVAKEKFLLVFAIIILIYYLVTLQVAEVAAFYGVIALIVISFFNKTTRINFEKFIELLVNFSKSFVPIAIIISLLGVFISSLMSTGAHVKLGLLVLGGFTNIFIISLLVFLLCIIFGMIVPIVAAYIAVVMIAVPVLAELGVALPAVHMFVFYCCALAPITPPVALAVFTGSSIAGSDPMKTAIYASKIAIPLWFVPFILLKEELFLGMNMSNSMVILKIAIVMIGSMFITISTIGYFLGRKFKYSERIGIFIAGLFILQPIIINKPIYNIVVAIVVFIYIFATRTKIGEKAKKEPSV